MKFIENNQLYFGSTLVTNNDFKDFVAATGYKTTAEINGNSFVFYMFTDTQYNYVINTPWWQLIDGAKWDNPFGPNSTIVGIENHPVVHVSYFDALAYATWRNARLPNEIEWERAANPEDLITQFPWGNDLCLEGRYMCNTWQGDFPSHNTQLDGYIGTSPVTEFPPNSIGLHDVVGNVWEWCSNCANDSIDEVTTQNKFKDDDWIAARGGSFLCHKSYCNKHVIGSRNMFQADTTSSNLGFRIVKDQL